MIYWKLTYLVNSPVKKRYGKKLFNRKSVHLNSVFTRHYTKDSQNLLGYYLAGLIEKDGTIILRKGVREKISPKVVFTFHPNQLPLYNKISQTLQTGIIYSEKRGVCRYTISNADAVIRLINIVNGKFRTPKIVALNKAIDNLNKWRNANIVKMPLDTGNLGDNPWLSGFIDADGHFSLKLTGRYKPDSFERKNTVRGRVQCAFSINQSELNRISTESNVPFMTQLAKFFPANLLYKVAKNVKFKNPAKLVVFYAQADKNHFHIISYLNKYPLMSSKHLNFLCFIKGIEYLGKQLTVEEINAIRLLKQSMNSKRTEFSWDHLKIFYNSKF